MLIDSSCPFERKRTIFTNLKENKKKFSENFGIPCPNSYCNLELNLFNINDHLKYCNKLACKNYSICEKIIKVKI